MLESKFPYVQYPAAASGSLGGKKEKSGHRTLTCAIVKWVPICPFEAY